MVSGGGNFLLGIYLARTLPLNEFGLYGLDFGICMLYVGMGNALILTQMMVNIPDKTAEEATAYAINMFHAVLLLDLSLLVISVFTYILATMFAPHFLTYMPQVFAIAVAAALFLCNEFLICYAYLRRKENLALMINLVTISVLFCGLLVEHILKIGLTAENALLLYALGATVASVMAYHVSPLQLGRNMREFLPGLRQSWHHGRWALGGVGLTWLQSQTYTYVLAFFVGSTGIGQANAARIFTSPFSFILTAINKIAIPRLVYLRRSNRNRMYLISMLLTVGLSTLTIIYSLILLNSLEFASKLILGRNDPVIMSLVWAWCLVLILQMIRSCGSILLQVQRKFRVLMLINIPSAMVTIGIAVLMMQRFGVIGAIVGMLAGEVVLTLLIWREIQRGRIDA